jgi:hypothetical protein
MTSTKNQKAEHSAQTQLEALLDKLVAVQLDLEPIHQGKSYGTGDAQRESIATAYGVLRSAIEDLRVIIGVVNGPVLR